MKVTSKIFISFQLFHCYKQFLNMLDIGIFEAFCDFFSHFSKFLELILVVQMA